MDFPQLIDLIGSKVKIEAVASALGESTVTEINSALRTLKAEHSDVQDALNHANTESKGRKLKLRDMTTAAESLQETIDDLKGQADTGKDGTTKMETELTELREFKAGTVKTMRTGFLANFGKMVDHPNFVKAKELFTLPAVDDKGVPVKAKDGSFDFSEVSDDQMEANITKANELATLGYFEEVKTDTQNKGTGALGKRTTGDGLIGQIQGAKSMAELEALAGD